jgi:phosphate transport system substrate-binding protein
MKLRLVCLLVLFGSCSGGNRAIKVKGSDTEVNLAVTLAENFYKVNKHFSVAISGGGSGMGIASLLNGQTDIANSSRPLNVEEIALFEKRGIALKTVVFAEDATAFIVNKKCPLDSIDVITLSALMSGREKTWQRITGKSLRVNIYGRQSNSGTHSFVSKKLNIQFCTDAKEMNGNAQIIEGVKLDESGIGYVGAGYLSAGGNMPVKVLKIKGPTGGTAVSPLDEQAIRENRYFFQRPLYQFIPTTSWNRVAAFVAFEQSAEGQAIIKRAGYYIVNNMQ